MNAKLLMQAGIETQAGWIKSEGIAEEDALARWELMRDYEPLLIVGFVKAFYVLKNSRIADQ